MKILVLVILISTHPLAALANEPNCVFSLKKKSAQVQWTAFKTSEKVAVQGKLPKIKIKGNPKGKSLSEMLKGLEFQIDTRSVATGNPARDRTLAEHFFGVFTGGQVITGRLKEYEADDREAEFQVKLNGKEQEIELKLTIEENKKFGKIVAKGGIDLLDLGLDKPFESIHRTCEKLHTGKDGVSKTWTTVELEIEARYRKICRP